MLSHASLTAPRTWFTVLFLIAAFTTQLHAAPKQNPTYDAWLRYERLDDKSTEERYTALPAVVVSLGDSEIVSTARDELVRGVRAMLGRTLRIDNKLPNESTILLATYEEAKKAIPSLDKLPNIASDGFWIRSIQIDTQPCLLIIAPNDRGVLYGVFTVLRKIALLQPLTEINERHAPAAPIRMTSQWDRLDGSVDNRPGNPSLFWEANHLAKDTVRISDYTRLLASVGINCLSVNEPREGARLLTSEYREELVQLGSILRPWGIRLFIAHDSTSAPGDAWENLATELYAAIPNFGGFVLDSDWGTAVHASDRDIASEVNAIAAAVNPFDGIIICRTSVCGPIFTSDTANDKPHDPAKITYDIFKPLDGRLDANVILQIKQGPMNFQVREPPSPLFGALAETNQAIELQLTQEHLGQQRHLCFLVPMWKQTLEFNMRAAIGGRGTGNKPTPVKELITGKTFQRPLGGFIAILNARRVPNWLGHDLEMANLYAFGRLAWDPNLNGKAIAEEWTRLTFSHDPLVLGTLVDMLLKSWRIYENYTGPLGAGTLTDAADSHYGPGIESSSTDGWLPWHASDQSGLGKDRSSATGTGFIAQYQPGVAERFESIENCPDDLLLFMHRVPYTHVLKSGKTVIQHIYDSHYNGARDAAQLAQQWESIGGRIDEERHRAVLRLMRYQAGHAQLWRDAVCNWFLQRSSIADDQGRVGKYPNRVEAEAMEHEGYEAQNVTPWETASGGQCAANVAPDGKGTVSMNYEGTAGWFDLKVRYFDENDGASKFRLLVADQLIDEWTADDTLPSNTPNGHTSTRRETRRVALRPGDIIRIETTADAGERAAIDYLEIIPAGK